MIEAVFIRWDDSAQAGIARSIEGYDYQLRYRDGQSFYTSDDYPFPKLTGRHAQPAGYHLKVPEVGDPVLVQLTSPGQAKTHWGYMRHYIDLVERRYGSRFLSAVDA
jgi:hypothetical protein